MKWTVYEARDLLKMLNLDIKVSEDNLQAVAKKIRRELRKREISIKHVEGKEETLWDSQAKNWLNVEFKKDTLVEVAKAISYQVGSARDGFKNEDERVTANWASKPVTLKQYAKALISFLKDERIIDLYHKFGEDPVRHELVDLLTKFLITGKVEEALLKQFHYFTDQTAYHTDRFYMYYSEETMEKKAVSIYNKEPVLDSKGNIMKTFAKKNEWQYSPIK